MGLIMIKIENIDRIIFWVQTLIVGMVIGYFIANSQWISALSDGHKMMSAEQSGKQVIKSVAKELRQK